jgi:hypothetical protein
MERPWYREPPVYPNREPTFEEAVAALYDPESAPIEAFYISSNPAIMRHDAADWLRKQKTPESLEALLEYARGFTPGSEGVAWGLFHSHRTPETIELVRRHNARRDAMRPDVFTLPDSELKRRNLLDTTRNPQVGIVVREVSDYWSIWLVERPDEIADWHAVFVAPITDGPMLSSYSWTGARKWSFQHAPDTLSINIEEDDTVTFDLTGLRDDSDGDGLTDRFETDLLRTDPHNADTDGDGKNDALDDNPLTPAGDGPLPDEALVLRAAARAMVHTSINPILNVWVDGGPSPYELPGKGGYILPRRDYSADRNTRTAQPVRPLPNPHIFRHGGPGLNSFYELELVELSETFATIRVETSPKSDDIGRVVSVERIDGDWFVTWGRN